MSNHESKLERENDFMRKLLSFLVIGEFDEIKVNVARNLYCTIDAESCVHDWLKQEDNPNVQGEYSVCPECRSVLFAGSDKPLMRSDAFKLVELEKIATDEYQRQMVDVT